MFDNLQKLHKSFLSIHDQFETTAKQELVGKIGILKSGKYKGRKATVLDVWDVDCGFLNEFRNAIHLRIGIERLDGKPDYIDDHNRSYIRIGEIEF